MIKVIKFTQIFLCLSFLAFSLSACGGGDESASTDDTNTNLVWDQSNWDQKNWE